MILVHRRAHTGALPSLIELCDDLPVMNSLSLNMWVPAIAAILVYLLAGGLLWRHLVHGTPSQQPARLRLLLPGLVAVLLHAALLWQLLFTPGGVDVGFYTIFTLVLSLIHI